MRLEWGRGANAKSDKKHMSVEPGASHQSGWLLDSSSVCKFLLCRLRLAFTLSSLFLLHPPLFPFRHCAHSTEHRAPLKSGHTGRCRVSLVLSLLRTVQLTQDSSHAHLMLKDHFCPVNASELDMGVDPARPVHSPGAIPVMTLANCTVATPNQHQHCQSSSECGWPMFALPS